MIRLLQISLLLLLAACSGSKATVEQSQAPPPPSWVSSRPMTSSYYTGIGVAQKSLGSNFQKSARENALSDLASEIKVNVSSNSLLYTLERDYKFEQEFRETINVSTNLDLEDFEIVDTWEDENSYWAYYRLNKSDYARNLQEKKEAAQNTALDFYTKARASESSQQFSSAADAYLRGLQAMESFWGESNEIEYQGQSFFLDNELFSGLRSLLTEQRISVEKPILLNYENRFKTVGEIRVTDTQSGFPQEGVPLQYAYFGTYGRYRGKISTNADGRAEVSINEADKQKESNLLTVAINTEVIFEPFHSDRFMRKLTESLRGVSIQEKIAYHPPSLYIDSREKNLGQDMEGAPLTSAIMASLGRRGVRFASRPADADLTMTLRTDTEKGGQHQGFTTSILRVNMDIIDNLSGENVYKVSRSDIKGVDLDFKRAGVKAYQNLNKNIESELMRKLVSDLF